VSGSDVKVAIKGDESDVIRAFNASKAKAAEASEAIAASLNGISAAFERIQGAMLAFTAILAGGKAFGEAIQASVGAAYGAQQLGKQLGITATQASVLKVAMDENFVSQESVTAAAGKISQTLKKNENAFKELGVATRDSNGNFRDSQSIMTDVSTKLSQFKEGTDRNVEGMKIYGRSWLTVMDTIRLTGPALEEAKVKADALGLTVGQEGVAQAVSYKTAMAGVHTVLDAMEKAIGDALVPSLTALGQWFVSVGPQAVAVMRTAIYSVYAAFSYAGEGGQVMIDAIWGGLDYLGAQFVRLAKTAERALHFDFAGAKAAWADGTATIEAKSAQMAAKIKADMKEASDARASLFESQDALQTPTAEKNGAASTGGDGKEKSQMAAFEAALEQRKAAWQSEQAAEGSYREFGKQQEIEYWQSILATSKTSAAEKTEILKKIASDQLAIQKSAFEGELATLKGEEEAHKENMTARLAIEQQYADKVKAAYGADSKEYAQAQAQILATKRAEVDQERKLNDIASQSVRARQLAEISMQEANAKQSLAMHKLTDDQYLALEQSFQARKFAIQEQALTQELSLVSPLNNPVAYKQLMAQIEAVATDHQAKMLAISRGAQAQEMTLTNQLTSSMSRGFATAFQGVINGTMTMGQAFKNVMSSMLQAVTQFISGWASKQLTAHAIRMTQSKEEIDADAAGAAVGGAKSASQIPYVGWAIAIGAAASIFSAMSGYKSAAGGFDIPSNINPMTQLHANEMVLPAPLAQRVRGMTENGDSSGTSNDGPVHIHLNGQRAGGLFTAHEDDLVAAFKAAVRKGKLG